MTPILTGLKSKMIPPSSVLGQFLFLIEGVPELPVYFNEIKQFLKQLPLFVFTLFQALKCD